ncbi:hypothetical protein [Streptomyces cinnamoneus]|nr:hypothetical protein [Streptomyces cinnamoneus]
MALATAGLMFAGTAGAAAAAPPERSPSTASSTGSEEEASSNWKPDGWYSSEECCHQAGDLGKHYGDWHEYQCKREEKHHGHHDYWWHLYYRS